MKKKLLAILLAAIMVMTLLPTVAMAATSTEIDEIDVTLNTKVGGKKASEIKDSILSFDDGYTVVATIMLDDSQEPLNDGDTIEVGESYIAVGVIQAPDGSYFKNASDDSEYADLSRKEKDGLTLNISGDAEMYTSYVGFSYYPEAGDYVDNAIVPDEEKSTYNTDTLRQEYYENTRKYQVTYCSVICMFEAEEAPAGSSGNANIKGVIDAADFAYKMVIPADTTLTEDDHTNKLLGNDGKVSIEVTKHSCDTIKVFYTVNLDNATLTDGETTITTTYGVSADGTNFTALAEDTKYPVYNAGAKVDSFINVSADETSWNDAPVGDYNATVVFNFDKAPLCKCGVDLTEYNQLLKIEHINDDDSVDAFLFEHDGEHFGLFPGSPFNFPVSIHDEDGDIASMINGSFNEGEYYHGSDDDCKKCTSPENLDVYDDVIFSVETVGITYFSVPAGSTYEITENNILIYPSSKYEPDALRKNNVDAYKLATVTLNGEPLATSATGTINNGDAFYFTVAPV